MFPAYSALNASVFPSGENWGFDDSPWKLVRRRARPPARSTIQMLLAYANAMCVALTVGDRNSRVDSPLAVSDGGAANGTASRNRKTPVRKLRRIDMEGPPEHVSGEN